MLCSWVRVLAQEIGMSVCFRDLMSFGFDPSEKMSLFEIGFRSQIDM